MSSGSEAESEIPEENAETSKTQPEEVEPHGKSASVVAVSSQKTLFFTGEKPPDSELVNYYAIEPVHLPAVIFYLCKYVMIYETFMCVCLILDLSLFPYDCFFNTSDLFVANFVYAMDILYGFDVLIRLIVEEWRQATQTRCMVFMFPYAMHHCIVDMISLFPFYRIPLQLVPYESLKVTDLGGIELYKIPILFRLYRVSIYFSVIELHGLLYEAMIFVIKFTLTYFYFILLVSVALFLLTDLQELEFFTLRKDREKIRGTWAENFEGKEIIEDPSGFFILTTTFATIMVTTVGYGDICPITEEEMFGSILIMLIGAIFLSGYFQSQITSFCLQLDGARLDLFHRLDGIKIALHQASMGEFFIAKVEQYYKCLWTYREGVDHVSYMSMLPHSFHEDILYDICLEMFHKSYLFHGLDDAFLRSVSKIVTIALYNPGMIVCRHGAYANKMYYIIQGECQAMSKHDIAKKSAILRAGNIIGETNLFFSSPYTISVETRSCCQVMCLDKEELMILFNKFNTELSIMRSRCQTKVADMYYFYEAKGVDPVCWVEIREQAHEHFIRKAAGLKRGTVHAKALGREPDWPNYSMRWGYGFNDLITEDVILDGEEFVIFDAPCDDKHIRKNHYAAYRTSVVPEILGSELTLINVWNITIIICALLYGFYGPYCLAFHKNSLIETYVCRAGAVIEYVNDIVYILDVFVEILGATPVEGLYYKFKDGLSVKKGSLEFYLDLFSAVPLAFFQHLHDNIQQANVLIKSTKMWKVIRYLNFMDNVHPKHVFWFRLTQTCLVLIYGIHFIACAIYIQACPEIDDITEDRDCTKEQNWLWSYYLRIVDVDVVDDSITVKSISTKNPYLVSFFYASATLTSAGFGDFSPQNKQEMCWAMIFTLVGFFLICYYTSVMTSALSCIVKPRLEFQQKLLSVHRFMEYYNLPDSLQRRVVQYYELQHQAHYGINLPHGAEHFFFDCPTYLKNDFLYTDLVQLMDGIPLFSKAEPKYIIKMADIMRRFLIPPNVLFLHRGEVRRTMYFIRYGSAGVYGDNLSEPRYILEGSCHFGIRDLLFGEPSHYSICTLSYCLIYEISNEKFIEVFEEDEELLDLIDDEREKRQEEIESLYNQYSKIEREQYTDKYIGVPSWNYFRPTKHNQGHRGRKYTEYEELYTKFACGRFFKVFLESASVHPVGNFAKWWSCWMSIVSSLTIMLLFVESYMYLRTPGLRFFQWAIDTFFYVDIYIKLHWGYYQPKTGIMVSHPLKTAGMYIFEGSFFTDVVFCTPLELLMFFIGSTNFLGYGPGATWYTKLRWIRFLQVKRIPQIFQIVHGIFVQRTFILFMLFVSLTVVVCSIVGSIALFIACPWEPNDWKHGDEYRLPSCLKNHWAHTKFDGDYHNTERVLASVLGRWIYGVYYVSQVLLVIGFGDMITLNPSELMLLILMSVFGFVFMRCITADMTAAEVDSDAIRATYTNDMKTLRSIMERERINRKLRQTVNDHLNNMWKQTKGLQPNQLFSDLHPSLESDVFRTYVGDTLRKVAVFQDFTPNVLRTLCLYLKKVHFLKGERVMKYGNLDYELFIIVTGKVWITDDKLSYGCTLGRYETFGESSMISFQTRRYNAIAATNLETYVIARVDFEALIERYPKVKDIFSALLGNGEYDYFEYKIYEMIDNLKELEGTERDRQIDRLESRTREIKYVVSIKENLSAEEAGGWERASDRNKFVSLLSKIVGIGTDDDDLPLLYFVGRRNQLTGKYSICPPLIHPNCALVKMYFTFIHIFCLLSPALAMYEFCFSQSYFNTVNRRRSSGDSSDRLVQQWIHIISVDCEYFFATSIVIKLITPYQNEKGFYVKNFLQIAIHYIFAWDGMFLDFFAVIPGLVYSEEQGIFLLFTRTIRLYHYYSYYLGMREDLRVSPFRLKVQLNVSTFVLLAHYIACVFYYISDCERNANNIPCFDPDRPEAKLDPGKTYTWTRAFVVGREINNLDDEQMHRWRWWVRSMYWVVTVISTTGFGDITPQNEKEMVVGIICFFAGAFILSIILSNFTAGMTSVTKAYREYLYQVKLLLKYLNNVGLSNIRQFQVLLFFNVLWQKCHGRMYHEITRILPSTLRIEVCTALYGEVLKKSFLFNSIESHAFISQVASRVTYSIYLPGVCIIKEGDLGNTMYIVFRGLVSGITGHGTDAMELSKVYLVGDVFGKLPCLFHNEYYRKSYRAEEVTEVLELHTSDVIHLASVYPEFWKLLKAYVELTYDPEGESDCIFSPQRARVKNIFDLGDDYQKAPQQKPAATAPPHHSQKQETQEKKLAEKPQEDFMKRATIRKSKQDNLFAPIALMHDKGGISKLAEKDKPTSKKSTSGKTQQSKVDKTNGKTSDKSKKGKAPKKKAAKKKSSQKNSK